MSEKLMEYVAPRSYPSMETLKTQAKKLSESSFTELWLTTFTAARQIKMNQKEGNLKKAVQAGSKG